MSDGRALPDSNTHITIETMPFIGRAEELHFLLNFLLEGALSLRRITIKGDSGVGKSFFIKEALYRFSRNSDTNPMIIYVDMSNDEFQSSRLISSILKLTLVSSKPTKLYPLSVQPETTFAHYQKKIAKRTSVGWDIIKGASQGLASLIGMGSAVNTALKSTGAKPTSQEDILCNYLSWVNKSSKIILTVDNYQFINLEVRLTLESILQRAGKNITLIVADRTIDGTSEIAPPLQDLSPYDKSLTLHRFSKEETEKITELVFSGPRDYLESLSSDIYNKTNGLAKDIEYCIKNYQLGIKNSGNKVDVRGLLNTIHKLPLMHRQLLLIAAMLDGGIQKNIVKKIIRRISIFSSEDEVDEILSHLIMLEYLKINSDTGTRIRAGHERIIQTMRELTSDELFDETRRSIIEEFEYLIDSKSNYENESYILHCLVGLQTAVELEKNLHFVARLVRRQYRDEQFSYLVNLAGEAEEVMAFLPDETVNLILDSMQKSSSFDKGLSLINQLERAQISHKNNYLIYKYKFFTQLYEYDSAERIAYDLPKSEWSIVYQVNALLALEKNHQALELIVENMDANDETEANAVLQRNSVTLFSPEESLKNLSKSEKYFKRMGSDFRLATVETNRGLVYLCLKRYGDVSRVLNKSISLMQCVGSKEIFQAQLNLAIKFGLEKNYVSAQKYLDMADFFVPASLLLDQIKIKMAKSVFGLLSNDKGRMDTARQLEALLENIKGVCLPYLRHSLEHNISTLLDDQYTMPDKLKVKLASYNKVSIYLPVFYEKSKTLIINPSVHWRY
ncbi:ATP-binding protein [Teredinibacter turnerae]|uniref:ATP-binding protein n=1 Tax=Teredinibacter turnerae TaxID=2426 RepID=UPI0005F89817|nr:ATP-binding protein [Teredinibacter turnerae]